MKKLVTGFGLFLGILFCSGGVFSCQSQESVVVEGGGDIEKEFSPSGIVKDEKGKIHLPIDFAERFPLLADADARCERLKWFKDSSLGLFVDLGLHTYIGNIFEGRTVSDSEWMLYLGRIEPSIYEKMATTFTLPEFSIDKALKFVETIGAKYVILNAKHHDGFTMFDSAYTEYDIVDAPENGGVDIYAELVPRLKALGIKVGFNYSILDWHHPSQARFNDAGVKLIVDVNPTMNDESKIVYKEYVKNQVLELVTKYDADLISFNGEWVSWWDSVDGWELQQAILEANPSVIVNDRIGNRTKFDGDYTTFDQNHPISLSRFQRPWQLTYQADLRYGFNAITRMIYFKDMVRTRISTASRGGNFLVKLTSKKTSRLPDVAYENFEKANNWLGKGESLLSNLQPLPPQFTSLVGRRYVIKDGKLYLFAFYFPGGSRIKVPEMLDKVYTNAYFLSKPDEELEILNQDEVLSDRAKLFIKRNQEVADKVAEKVEETKPLEGEGVLFDSIKEDEMFCYKPVDYRRGDYGDVKISIKNWPKSKELVVIVLEYEDISEEEVLSKYGNPSN